jgi:hypothetical protein
MNLLEGIFAQMDRCRKLINAYEENGPIGTFGKAMIESEIKNAEHAIASGDTVAMIAAYKKLQECE